MVVYETHFFIALKNTFLLRINEGYNANPFYAWKIYNTSFPEEGRSVDNSKTLKIKLALVFLWWAFPQGAQRISIEHFSFQSTGESEKVPKADSEVKFRYPEYVRISVGEADNIPIGVFVAGQDSDDEDEEMSEDGEEDEPEVEFCIPISFSFSLSFPFL